jgi:hypothetical protein
MLANRCEQCDEKLSKKCNLMPIIKTGIVVTILLFANLLIAQKYPYFNFESRNYQCNGEMFDPLIEKNDWKDFNLKGQVKRYVERRHFI